MERPTDRDLDRLLEGALPDTLGPASAACVDAEQLAVWADGGLMDEERARIDAHVAGCERCLTMTAMFMRAEREPPAAVMTPAPTNVVAIRRPWARPVWLAPLAAAAAVTMWFVWPRPDGSVLDQGKAKPATEVARLEPAPSAPIPQSSTFSQQQGQSSPSTAAADAAKLTETAPIAGAGEVRNAFRGGARAEGPARQDAQGKDAQVRREAQVGAAPIPAPSVVAPAATSPSAPPVRVTTGAAAPAPLPAPPPPAAAPAAEARVQQKADTGDVAANRVAGGMTRGIMPARPALEIVTTTVALADQPAGNAASAGRGGGGGGRAAGFSAITATSPRWRVLDEVRVERSADEGVSWQPLAIGLPAGSTIVSGTSPAPGVCWLVGRRGLVLLSTNGTRFDIVTSPTDADLASIRATSARSANVTTADGRVFVTTDGGQTWRLQGFPAGPF